MYDTVVSPGNLPSNETPEPGCQARCPFCGGWLALIHNLWRCVCCGFSICDGCDGESAESW
jgi:hypothetical protein